MHTLQVQQVTPEHTLHSRVKDFITHNSIVIFRESLLCFLSFQLFFLAILLKLFSKLFPQKAALFDKINADIQIKHKKIYLVTNKYLK